MSSDTAPTSSREGQEQPTEAAYAWLVTRFRAIDTTAAEEARTTLEGFRSAVAHEQGADDYVIVADVDDPTSTWLAEPFVPVRTSVIARTRAGRGDR